MRALRNGGRVFRPGVPLATTAAWILAAIVLLVALGEPAAAQAGGSPQQTSRPPAPAPASPQPAPEARYRLAADSGHPLGGITSVQLLVGLSAREADGCQVSATDLRDAAAGPLRAAGLTVLEAQAGGDTRAGLGVPEVFVPVTVLRDESGVCAASMTLQLGVDADVVMLHRNANASAGTIILSPGYVPLERSERISIGVPPTFGTEVIATIRELATELAGKVAAARAAPRLP